LQNKEKEGKSNLPLSIEYQRVGRQMKRRENTI